MPYRKDNILIVMTDKHMGNLIVSIPAIRALLEHFKNKNVFLLIDALYREIVESVISKENMILFHRRELKKMSSHQKLREYFKLIKKIRAIKPELSIDLEGRQASATFSFLSGAKIRVGRISGERPYLYNKKVNVRKNSHRVFGYMDIAKSVGANTDKIVFYVQPTKPKEISLDKKLLSYGIQIKDRPYVCLHPGAGKIYKQWPIENFAEVADWLTQQGFAVVIIGGKSDERNSEKLIQLMQSKAYNLTGRLSLGELVALLKSSELYIGNDSGPLHLAAATGIPVVGLFGPADDRRWGPLGENSYVLRGYKRCSKCKGKDCAYDFRCIKKLQVKNVIQTIEDKIINKRRIYGIKT